MHYLTRDGKDPFARWMEGIKATPVFRRVLIRLDRAEDGNLGDHRGVGDGVCEMRDDFGPGVRIYYAEDGDDLLLLTGGTKDTQDVDISRAKAYRRNHDNG